MALEKPPAKLSQRNQSPEYFSVQTVSHCQTKFGQEFYYFLLCWELSEHFGKINKSLENINFDYRFCINSELKVTLLKKFSWLFLRRLCEVRQGFPFSACSDDQPTAGAGPQQTLARSMSKCRLSASISGSWECQASLWKNRSYRS